MFPSFVAVTDLSNAPNFLKKPRGLKMTRRRHSPLGRGVGLSHEVDVFRRGAMLPLLCVFPPHPSQILPLSTLLSKHQPLSSFLLALSCKRGVGAGGLF